LIFVKIIRELEYANMENITAVDLIRKFQYQVGKVNDMTKSDIIKKAGKIFSRTTILAVHPYEKSDFSAIIG
jgi:hypothetical protein